MNYNFSENYTFEFSYGRDYLKDVDEDCFRTPQIDLSEQEPNAFFSNLKYEDGFANCFSRKEENVFSSDISYELPSFNTLNKTPALSVDNTMSTGKQKDDDICCDDIDTLSAKECDTESHSNFVNECANGDLNLFVEKLLNATGVDYLEEQGIKVDDSTRKLLTVNKRKRKTKKQVEFLENEYKKNPDWTKEDMQILADQLNMTPAAIYKWHWDQSHKSTTDTTKKTNKRDKKSKTKTAASKSKKTGSKNKRAKCTE